MKVLSFLVLLTTLSNNAFALTYKSLDSSSAKYEVPVSIELKHYASFEIPDLEKKIKGNAFEVEYTLPEILAGNKEFIKLTGKINKLSNEIVLVGDKAIAKCKGIYIETTCTVEYYNLEIDEEKAIMAIKNISQSDMETAGRIEVMRAFSTDPVGIITY